MCFSSKLFLFIIVSCEFQLASLYSTVSTKLLAPMFALCSVFQAQ